MTTQPILTGVDLAATKRVLDTVTERANRELELTP